MSQENNGCINKTPIWEHILRILVCMLGFLLAGCYVETGVGFRVTPVVTLPVPVVVQEEHVIIERHYHHRRQQPQYDNYNNFCYVCEQYKRGQHLQHR